MGNFHLGYILWASVVAVLKLVLLTVTGALMEKWGILNPQIRKSLSKVCYQMAGL
jgi:predicted permease